MPYDPRFHRAIMGSSERSTTLLHPSKGRVPILRLVGREAHRAKPDRFPQEEEPLPPPQDILPDASIPPKSHQSIEIFPEPADSPSDNTYRNPEPPAKDRK
jgi:hypothetical protein